jgi:hypothetical protein
VFLPEEGRAGHERVVLLSDGLWGRRFGADRAVLGRKLVMNGQSTDSCPDSALRVAHALSVPRRHS